MKKILFATSEAVPFIKTGGLADVTGSLPKYINKEEYDVRVILPKYLCMNSRFEEQLCFKCHLWVDLAWRRQYVGVYETVQDGVTYYFVDNEFYFAGDRPYNQIFEDIEKFAFFSKAVLEALPYIDFCPDIIHCHDWQTGLIPAYLRTLYSSQNYYVGIRTVFTIHNLKFQGRWMLSEVKDITGLPENVFTSDKLEAYGEANYLKGGLVYADAITTVSKTYAKEIMTVDGGEGLHGLLSARSNDVYGIVNGLDYDVFNPEKDAAIAKNFKVTNVKTGKKANKLALQKEFALPEDEGTYLMGMVGRLTDQKGLDLVAYIMEELLQTAKMQIIVLGTGEGRYEEMFRYFENKYPNQIKAYIGYSEELAHRIYASCDSFLMPSLFEPCGLSQLMSMRYGTLPIVRETGGLKDTVEAYNEYEQTGTGFSFKNYNAHEMLDTIRYSLKVYYDQRKQWDAMVKRAMKQDFSWNRSAKEYEKLYDRY